MRAALYARYSTEQQREASIVDQLRVAERLAAEHGFEVVARFSDAAISGGTAQRPGYQQLLEAARCRQFDAIIVEDSSRLWRNSAEQQQRLAELHDLGICVIGRDLDTRAEGAHFVGAIFGATNEHFRREIGRKTYRGVEGNAIAHRPTGGKAYGFVAARDSDTGQIEINQEEATVVRRIFAMYADGASPRTIAERLNIEGVPSPGASWARKDRRKDCKWLASALHGDPKRASGILNNPRYIGRIEWGRMKWHRSYRDSAKRRPELLSKPAHVYQEERLRIVPQDLWEAVRARQALRSATLGARVARGLKREVSTRSNAPGQGAPPRHLLSGLLRCGQCGASFVMRNAHRYQCASYVNGGEAACGNSRSFLRTRAEQIIVDTLRADLADPEMVAEVERLVRQAVRAKPRPTEQDRKRIEQLKGEVQNLTDAIAQGMLRSSGAIAQRLVAAETELQRLEEAAKPAKVQKLVPNVRERFQGLLGRLDSLLLPQRGKVAAGDGRLAHVTEQGRVEAARATILEVVGPQIDVVFDPSGGELWAEWEPRFGDPVPAHPPVLAAGGKSGIMVAGVGFEPTTFGL